MYFKYERDKNDGVISFHFHDNWIYLKMGTMKGRNGGISHFHLRLKNDENYRIILYRNNDRIIISYYIIFHFNISLYFNILF